MGSVTAPFMRSASVKSGGRTKVFIGALIILGAIAYVTFNSFQANAIYYMTLKEYQPQRSALTGLPLRINAPLDRNSIQWDDKALILKFSLIEDNLVLPVVYKGVKPDTFEQGESVVVEGRVGQDGIFQASTILVKCPSKYESQPGSSN